MQFLYIALRSLYETVTVIKLSSRLGYLEPNRTLQLEANASEVGRLVQALINALERRLKTATPDH